MNVKELLRSLFAIIKKTALWSLFFAIVYVLAMILVQAYNFLLDTFVNVIVNFNQSLIILFIAAGFIIAVFNVINEKLG